MFAVFNYFYSVIRKKIKNLPPDIRKELEIEENAMIDCKYIPQISEFYCTKFDKKLGYILVDSRGKFIPVPDSMKITESF